MDAAQRQLSDQIDHATQRLLGTAREIADPELRRPSLLPGWTRAHVLAHLARGADAMRHLLVGARSGEDRPAYASEQERDRKSTRLNSSHGYISYAVFCLKKKKKELNFIIFKKKKKIKKADI